MSNTVYITVKNALEVYHKTLSVSGGGSDGVLDLGRLESVLTHIQNDLYYPEFVDKLTHLFSVQINSIVLKMEINELPSLWERSFYF